MTLCHLVDRYQNCGRIGCPYFQCRHFYLENGVGRFLQCIGVLSTTLCDVTYEQKMQVVESQKLLVWKTLGHFVIVPFIVSLPYVLVSVETRVVSHILPSCERGVTLTEEVSGCEVYKHTIQNCSFVPLYDNTVVSCDVPTVNLSCSFCGQCNECFYIPTKNIYIQVLQKCL